MNLVAGILLADATDTFWSWKSQKKFTIMNEKFISLMTSNTMTETQCTEKLKIDKQTKKASN